MKDESAHGSPELLTDTMSQRKTRLVPVNFMPVQAETSAFHRVANQSVGLIRQPIRGYVQPAGVAHTVELVSTKEPGNSPISSPPMPTNANSVTRFPADSKLEDEKSDFHQNRGTSKLDYSCLETEQEKPPMLPSEIRRQEKSRECHFRESEFEKPTVGKPKPERALERFEQWMPGSRPKNRENVERNGRVLYLQITKGNGQAQEETSVKHKLLTRSMSDSAGSPKMEIFKTKELFAKNMMEFQSTEAKIPNGEITVVDTKVSVAQLRNAFLETANGSKKPEL